MEIQDYTGSEFKHALARNLRSLTRGKKSSKQPIAILLGGQSGAGKTTSEWKTLGIICPTVRH